LKNESITIIRDYAPDAVFGELFLDTKKGTVAHMKPPLESVMAASEPVAPGWIVMPRYTPRSHTTMMPAAKAVFCLHLANNSFNYNVLHEQGFRAVTGLVERCGCYDFRYSDLDSAMAAFAALAEGRDAN
jgi:hypothetical protein